MSVVNIVCCPFFFFNDTATTEIYTLSLHDALPIGLRGTASDSYTVSDLFVPEAYSSTREDPSLRRERGRLYAFPQQTMYSVGISSVALGIARGMLDAFMELACRKTPRGM